MAKQSCNKSDKDTKQQRLRVLLVNALETDAVDLLMTEVASIQRQPPRPPQKICIKMQGFGRFPLLVSVFYDRETQTR